MRIALTFGFAAMLAATAAQAQSYDIHDDFSITNNPNGVWSYGYEPVGGGPLSFVPYNENTDTLGNATLWNAYPGPQNSLVPADWNNATNTSTQANGLDPAQAAVFHPGADGEMSIFRFTAPSAGTYEIAGSMQSIDSGQTDGAVVVGGVSAFDTGDLTEASSVVGFDFNAALVAGETVDFEIKLGSNGIYYNDSVEVAGTVTDTTPVTNAVSVPEPGSLALLAGGMVGLAALRRRRRG